MAKIDFKLDRNGVRYFLNCTSMKELVTTEAQKRKNICGEGYETQTGRSGNRIGAIVYTDTYEAAKDNSEHNTLLRALKS